MEKKNIIINLHESGIEPEIIALELDIDKDDVMKVIKVENEMKKMQQIKSPSNYLLNKFYLDAIIEMDQLIKESQIRTWNALKSKPDFSISIKETQSILEKYSESTVELVILNIDLIGSTKMSLSLPIDRLSTIIRSFVQQMSTVVSLYGGYVLKYIGDAVLAFFVIEDKNADKNNEKKDDINQMDTDTTTELQYGNAISCACAMIKVIQNGINPILNQYDYPELNVRIGIDFGKIAVVQYGTHIYEFDSRVIKKPHIDLIGYTISMAVKMTSLAKPNNMVIGQNLFDRLDVEHKKLFLQLAEDKDIWNYSSQTTGKIYNLYGGKDINMVD